MKYVAFLLLISIRVSAQTNYPQNYFRNPVNIPILLAGNFGECRPGHFHSGIDIKTEGKENLPVFAAADGYISRIKMEPGGFGHAIYITHPNGYTTLYAHLNDFFPELQKLVRAEQYAKKEWTLDLNFGADKFPIKKGQKIAWSGNTGGSSAPHLHFEIRDSKTEHPLNPQLFGLKTEDNISPIPTEIALYNASESIYKQKAIQLKLRKGKNYYSPIKDSVVVFCDAVNIGVAVNDFMNNSTNTLSFYTAKWFANDSLIGAITLDDIGYDETRYINACADYKLQKETGAWFNSLFLLPNNQLKKIYKLQQNESGKIRLTENESTSIRILLSDVIGNVSEIRFSLIHGGLVSPEICEEEWKAKEQKKIENPNLKFTIPNTALYDNICFQFNRKNDSNAISSRFQIQDYTIPIHNYFQISIKPEILIPFSLNHKVALCYSDGRNNNARSVQLSEGWYSASVRAFGDYWLAIDTTAPTIKFLQKNGIVIGAKKELRFEVSDNATSVKTFTGTINGQWLCFEQHGKNWFYRIDEHCPKGKNKLQLIAVDENGNEQKTEFSFVR
ncbi:MAG: M23 family metallopeptidase [Bacteroidota bacterium]